MFEPKKGQIPGYTGHQGTEEKPDQVNLNKDAEHRIPGYGGYVPGIKSENVYGKTFGKTSFASAACAFERGIEPNVDEKFKTTSAHTLIDHSTQKVATVAEIVGIQRAQDTYAKPVDPETIRQFFGTDLNDGDGVVADQKFNRDAAKFYGESEAPNRAPAAQTDCQAMDNFFGMDQPQKGQMIGAPIPGYSGTNRRINADNLFGMTYAEARNAADQSQSNIDQEKGNTNKVTSTFVPGYTGMTKLQ